MKSIALFFLLLPFQEGEDEWKEIPVGKFGQLENDFGSHRHLVFLGTEADVLERVEALDPGNRKKIGKLATLEPGGNLHVYALFGWSRSGADPLRRTGVTVEVNAEKKIIRVTVTMVKVLTGSGGVGTADMRYVGFKAGLAELEPGAWTLLHREILKTYKTNRDNAPRATKPGKKSSKRVRIGR